MSSSTAAAAPKINPLRARLVDLALAPRVRLLPDGPAIVRELVDLLDQVAALERRVVELERYLGRDGFPQVTEIL